MGTGTVLAIQLVTAALQHASELNQLVLTAQAQGRDITPEELAAVRAKAVSAIDKLEADAA